MKIKRQRDPDGCSVVQPPPSFLGEEPGQTDTRARGSELVSPSLCHLPLAPRLPSPAWQLVGGTEAQGDRGTHHGVPLVTGTMVTVAEASGPPTPRQTAARPPLLLALLRWRS